MKLLTCLTASSALLFSALCFGPSIARAANTIYVSPTGHDTNTGAQGSPFKTITHSLLAMNPGDILMLMDGTYSGTGDTNVTLDFPITVASVNGAGHTFIDGGGGNWAFQFTAGTSGTPMVLKGITVQNCASGPSSSGAVSLVSSTAQIANCRFINDSPTSAVSVDAGSTCAINASEFAYNVGASGGGVYAQGNVTVANSLFDGNMATNGGAIFTAAAATLFNSTFLENHATTNGGAVDNFGNPLTVTGCSFTGNVGDSFGGGIANYGSTTISTSSFFGNQSPGYGGAIFNNHLHILTVQNDIMAQNWAGHGGAIYNDGSATINYSTITQNTSANGGGEYTTLTNSLTDDIIWGNGTTDIVDTAGTTTAKNCDFGPNAVAQTSGISADPQFVDASGGDFSLQPTSPCRHVAAVINGVTTDFKGRPRSSTTPTIGAIEGGVGGEFQFVASTTGPDGVERDLWQGLSDDAGDFTLWRVVPPASATTAHKFGPFNYGKPLFIGVGANLHERVLWFDPGTWKITLFDIAPNLTYTTLTMGPYTNSTPTSMSVGSDNHVHVVFSNPSGTIVYYNISTDNTFTTKTYGPY